MRVVIPYVSEGPPADLPPAITQFASQLQREAAARYIRARDGASTEGETLSQAAVGSATPSAELDLSELCFVTSSRAADGCRADVAVFVEVQINIVLHRCVQIMSRECIGE